MKTELATNDSTLRPAFTFLLFHPKFWLALGLAAITSLFPTSLRHSIGN